MSIEIQDIIQLYNDYRKLYFNNRLPKANRITFEWTNNKQSIGSCGKDTINTFTIRLSKPYHSFFPDELGDTLLHEMIHLRVSNHSKKFYDEMKRIQSLGGNVHRYTQHSLRDVLAGFCFECDCCHKQSKSFRNIDIEKYTCRCGGKLIRVE